MVTLWTEDDCAFTSTLFITETAPQFKFKGLQRELWEGERNREAV